MVIGEETTNPFTNESLADQLQKASSEQFPSAAPSPQEVKQAQTIEAIPQKKQANTVDLLDDSKDLASLLDGSPKYTIKRYTTPFVLAVVGILVFVGLSFLMYRFYQYLDLKSEPVLPANNAEVVQKVSDTYDEYGQMLGLFDKDQFSSISLIGTGGNEKASTVIKDGKLNFVQKKDLLDDKLKIVSQEIIQLKNQTKEMQESINKDGFFPQELVGILKTDNAVGSIQRSLLSLEVVKFSSAVKVFSLIDVFVSSLADGLGYTKGDIKYKLSELIERGEKDIEYYLNVCYNNPYEPAKCDRVNDFDMYYKRTPGEEAFDVSFFKTLMEFVDNKLEYSNIPSFSIIFNSFDGKSNSIGFTVEVNTLKEDEYALIQQGVKSPHIFIVSELIKLLKQSTFIVGKAIDAKDIKVTPKQITIGGSKYVVNNSVKTFNLPIQKMTEREIFDFIDKYAPHLATELHSGFDFEATGAVDIMNLVDGALPLEESLAQGSEASRFVASGLEGEGDLIQTAPVVVDQEVPQEQSPLEVVSRDE